MVWKTQEEQQFARSACDVTPRKSDVAPMPSDVTPTRVRRDPDGFHIFVHTA
jgi:hypothetical protein